MRLLSHRETDHVDRVERGGRTESLYGALRITDRSKRPHTGQVALSGGGNQWR